MVLFTTCPYCTVDTWGWQRACSNCAAAIDAAPSSTRTGSRVVSTIASRIGRLVALLVAAMRLVLDPG